MKCFSQTNQIRVIELFFPKLFFFLFFSFLFEMATSLETDAISKRLEDTCSGGVRVQRVWQESLSPESNDVSRLCERMGLGRVRSICSIVSLPEQPQTALFRAYANIDGAPRVSCILEENPNIGHLAAICSSLKILEP